MTQGRLARRLFIGLPGLGRIGAPFDRPIDPSANRSMSAHHYSPRWLAGGFRFTEGPLWLGSDRLLFTDGPANRIYSWSRRSGVVPFWPNGRMSASVLRSPNGMTSDAEGRVVVCGEGSRNVCRFEADGTLRVIAEKFEGRRLNSPNDVVLHPSGALYFTDPPHGLASEDEDPEKELAWNGIYRLSHDKLTLVWGEMKRPNGLAFSPNYRTLYVSNSENNNKVCYRFEVRSDGRLTKPTIFLDARSNPHDGWPDGIKVDALGNVFACMPGGIWVASPGGRLLGTILLPEVASNCAWGGTDRTTLYATAGGSLYSIQAQNQGAV